jgi:hypothetical protein
VATCVAAENSNVHPAYYDPDVPRIVWYYRVLTLTNARAEAEAYRAKQQEQRAKWRR